MDIMVLNRCTIALSKCTESDLSISLQISSGPAAFLFYRSFFIFLISNSEPSPSLSGGRMVRARGRGTYICPRCAGSKPARGCHDMPEFRKKGEMFV